MKKNKPITISEMDVEPISEEELQALTGTLAVRSWSDICECWNCSSEWVCYSSDQA